MKRRDGGQRDFPFLEPGEAFLPGGYFPIRGKKIGLGKDGAGNTKMMERHHRAILKSMPNIIHLDGCMLDDDIFRTFLIGLPKCVSGILISHCSLKSVPRADALVDFILSRAKTFSHLRIEETNMTYASLMKVIRALQISGAPLEVLEISERMITQGCVRDALFSLVCPPSGGGMRVQERIIDGEKRFILHPPQAPGDAPPALRTIRLQIPMELGVEWAESPFPLYSWANLLDTMRGEDASASQLRSFASAPDGGGYTVRMCVPSDANALEVDRFILVLGEAHGIETLEIDGGALDAVDRGRVIRAIGRMRGLRNLVVDAELFTDPEFLELVRGAMLERIHVHGFRWGMDGFPKDWVRILVREGLSWPIREFGIHTQAKLSFSMETIDKIASIWSREASVLSALLGPILIPRIASGGTSPHLSLGTEHIRMVAEFLYTSS